MPRLQGLVYRLQGFVPRLQGLVYRLQGFVPRLQGLVYRLRGPECWISIIVFIRFGS